MGKGSTNAISTEQLVSYWYSKVDELEAKKNALQKQLENIGKELNTAINEKETYKKQYRSEKGTLSGLNGIKYNAIKYVIKYDENDIDEKTIKIFVPKKKKTE